MDKIESYYSKPKAKVRNIASRKMNKPSKFSMGCPSVDALDFKQNFKVGNYDANTKLLPIENNPDRIEKVNAQISKLTKNAVDAICKNTCDVALELYLNLKEKQQLDYMFYDICGHLTTKIGQWFSAYQEYLKNGIRLPMTIKMDNKRGYAYDFKSIKKATKNNFFRFIEKIIRKNDIELHFLSGSVSQKAIECLYSQLYMIYCCMPDKIIEIKGIYIYNNADENKRKKGQRGKMAENMAFIDMEVYDAKSINKDAKSRFQDILDCYNRMAKGENLVFGQKVNERKTEKKVKKTKKVAKKKVKNIKYTTARQIAQKMNLIGNYKSLADFKQTLYKNYTERVASAKNSWVKVNVTKYSNLNESKALKEMDRILAKSY